MYQLVNKKKSPTNTYDHEANIYNVNIFPLNHLPTKIENTHYIKVKDTSIMFNNTYRLINASILKDMKIQ